MPFHDNGGVNRNELEAEIDWVFSRSPVSGVVTGMVSEVLKLSSEERDLVNECVCQASLGRGAAIVSVGAESTHMAIRYATGAEEAGATAVMAIPPIAVPLGDGELFRYYEELIASVSIPLVVQDASGYVGRPMPIAMQAHLLDRFGDRIFFKPEADPIGPRLSQLRDATDHRARVFEGTGGMALVDSHKRGLFGTMPGADLAWAVSALWAALQDGSTARADAISDSLVALAWPFTGLDSFVALEKYLLNKQGVLTSTATRRPSNFELDRETRLEIDRRFERVTRAVTFGIPRDQA